MKSAPTITFDYQPSRQVRCAAAVFGGLALVAIWTSSLSALSAVIVSLGASSVAVCEWRWWLAATGCRVGWTGGGQWTLAWPGDDPVAARLRAHRLVGAWIVLRLHGDGVGAVSLVLTRDNLASELLRRLRIRLARESVAVDAQKASRA